MQNNNQRNIETIQFLQQKQLQCGTYALIPESHLTYEEAIQSMVACDLRMQLEERRRRKMQSSEIRKSA